LSLKYCFIQCDFGGRIETEQRKGMKNPEMCPCEYAQLIFDKVKKPVSCYGLSVSPKSSCIGTLIPQWVSAEKWGLVRNVWVIETDPL
jgi:hypothetical protein